MLTALYVTLRVVANPAANVFQKQLAQRGADPLFIIGATHALLSLAALPILASGAGARSLALGSAFWMTMGICAVLAVAGNVLLVYALRSSELSILGPINAYRAVLGLALGVVLLGEVPTAFGFVGVLLIVVGSSVVVERAQGQTHGTALRRLFQDPGVQLRFAAMFLSATEAVFLKRAVLLSTPVTTFLYWSILGLPVAAVAIAVLARREIGAEAEQLRHQWRTCLWLAFTTGTMQLATLITFGALQVGYSLALFQLSTLISVFFGYRYFQERDIGRRLIGSAVMVVGAILIVTLGARGSGPLVDSEVHGRIGSRVGHRDGPRARDARRADERAVVGEGAAVDLGAVRVAEDETHRAGGDGRRLVDLRRRTRVLPAVDVIPRERPDVGDLILEVVRRVDDLGIAARIRDGIAARRERDDTGDDPACGRKRERTHWCS